MDLTIQIVNFRSRHYLEKCLFSIAKNLPKNLKTEIIIINNDEKPLNEAHPRINSNLNLELIEINQNIGFAKAHNIGAQEAKGKFVLFLNPDTRIQVGALSEMIEVLQKKDKAGIVGPLLVDSAGNVQPDCFGNSRNPLSIIGGKIFSQKKPSPDLTQNEFEADWVSGGAMLVKKNAFDEIGKFDENYFMYFEDVDFCLRAKKLGWHVMVSPSALIFHESGKSFENEREKKKHYYASQDYYLRKHFGTLKAEILRLLRLPYYVKNVWLS